MSDSIRVKSQILAMICALWIATPATAEISVLCGTEVSSYNEISYGGNTLTEIRQEPSRISTPNALRCNTNSIQESFYGNAWPDYSPFIASTTARAEFTLTTNGDARIIESRGSSTAEINGAGPIQYIYTGRAEVAVQNIIKIASDTPLYYRFLSVSGYMPEFPDFSFISPAGESLAGGALEGIIYNPDGSGNVELKIASSVSLVRTLEDNSWMVGSGPDWNFRLFVTPVPEPSTQLMLLSGLLGVGLWGRKRFAASVNNPIKAPVSAMS